METEDNKSYDDIEIDCDKFAELIAMVNQKTINRTVAKKVLMLLYTENVDPTEYVKEHNLGMVADTGLLEEMILSILQENPKPVAQFREGNEKVLGFLIGKVMAKTAGKADPVLVKEILITKLKQ